MFTEGQIDLLQDMSLTSVCEYKSCKASCYKTQMEIFL